MTELINVNQREISVDGRKLFIDLVSMDNKEGMLLTEAANVFGVNEGTIWDHIKNHNFCSPKISGNKLKKLKEQGVIGKRTTRATFLTKDTIRVLIKIINTEVCWEIYNQLWKVTDKAYELHTQPQSQLNVLQGMLNALQEQQSEISTIRCETPRIIDHRIETVLKDKQAFPEDCIRIGDLVSQYFNGVAKDKVLTYLYKIDHPRGNHVHIDDHGLRSVSHPFKIYGLEKAARKFFKEREFVKETEKSTFWFHPLVGNMREAK